MKRREFFKAAAIYGAAGAVPVVIAQEKDSMNQHSNGIHQIPLASSPGTRKGDVLYRTLGRTGERVSAIGMGGFTSANQVSPTMTASASSAQPLIAASPSWTTVGTTTKAAAKSAWVRR